MDKPIKIGKGILNQIKQDYYYTGILLKKFQDGRITGVNVGYSAILFNKAYYLDNWDDYKLDYQFYITEANKLKNPLIYI